MVKTYKTKLKTVQLRHLVLMLIMSSYTCITFGQGTIRGKVSDKTGETLIGVTVVLKEHPSVGAATDLDGNYTLKISDSVPQTLIISYVSFQTKEEIVHPVNGQVIVKDFVLESASSKDLVLIEIKTKATHANAYYMENIKKNSATTLDYISNETMKKTGDVSVANAVARVTGVSTNGGFITVRGIGDRYVKTTINGSRIPTLDPFTNNIKLDMFPANLVDNIIITKTASPDLPGDFSGAYLSVETKDYPEAFSLSIETSAGYNNQSTFKDIVSSQRSKTDWEGFDNSFREHDHSQFTSAVMHPTQYQELTALGLGDYYKSMGVTGWADGSTSGDLYFKLGLVQLGLLAPALINDPTAVANAKNAYNSGSYHADAFATINAGAAKTGKSFPDNWNTILRKAPLNFSQSFTVGDQLQLFGKPLGFIAGFRYGSTTIYDPNSIASTPYAGTSLLASYRDQQVSRETNGWSALINLAYKPNPNNTISVLFMPNLIGVNNVKDSYDTIKTTVTKAQFYEARKQMVYQYKSEHYIPSAKLKLDLNASYTKGNSNAPDFKYLQYDDNIRTNSFVIDPGVNSIDRYYRYLSDNLFDSRISAELPLGEKPELARKLKFGGAYQNEKTTSDQYDYFLGKGPHALPLQNDDVNAYFSLDQFDVSHGTDISGVPYSTLNWYYNDAGLPTDHTFGKSKITSAFLMTDYTIIPRLRASGGLRIEHTEMFTDVDKFDSLGLADNDPRRYYKEGTLPAVPGRVNKTNFLPSINLIYKLIKNEDNPVNIRAGFSQTLARPSLREISNISSFDYELQTNVTGNPDLKMVQIKNYDFRIESYFKNKDNISLSVFYKDFKNHIELERSDVYYWQNVDKSHVTGIEIEGRKGIIKNLEFRANFTLVKSLTSYVRTRQEVVGGTVMTYNEDTVTRPMFGQAPYIVNGILTYTSDSLGLTATLSYNVQGPRLVIGSNNKSIPDVYELQRHLLDFKVSKKVGKHFSVSVTIRDILNSPVTRVYKYDDGSQIIFDKYRWGTNYILSVLYKI
ncbi:MAG: carboxypeptidase-like regulatory domain-containing protein [Bacteroidia bacterium]